MNVTPTIWQIIRGGKSISPIFFLFDPPGPPIAFLNHNLTGVTEIKSCFQNDDGSELMISLTGGQIAIIGDPMLGRLQITLTAAQTILLEEIDIETIEFSLIIGAGDPVPFQIPGAYQVLDSKC